MSFSFKNLVAVITILTLLTFGTGALQMRKCDPLIPNANVEVTCSGSGLNSTNSTDCSLAQEPGTTAAYKCKKFYTLFDFQTRNVDQELALRCGANGAWTGKARFMAYRCKEDCGNVEGNVKPLVINGVPTYRSLNPWHAMLFVSNDKNQWTYLCGGSIIRSQVVLTAAHCIVAGPERYRVILGGVSTIFSKNSAVTGSQIFAVHRHYISENYDPKNGYQADIALLQLAGTIEYNDYIAPICLPNDYSADVGVIRNGVRGRITGFGLTENGTVPDSLRQINLNVKSSLECYNSLHRVLSESQFCAGSKQGEVFQTVCNGDSGNGMIFLSPVQEKYYVHGIVSSSDSDARKGICQNFAVFTRIYPFVFWIRDVLEEISGQIGFEFVQNVPYPYFLYGNEVQFEVYQGLPIEWENRVTRLDLRYVYIQVNDLFTSLEYAKTLNSIHITQAVFDEPISQKSALPLLNQFELDLPQPDFEVNDLRTFPGDLSESSVKSYLFFYKDYSNRDWSFDDLLSMKTDIDLKVHIFRLLHLNFTRGNIFMNQLHFADKLLQKAGESEFKLRRLALHRSSLQTSLISTSAQTLTSLILDKVNLTHLDTSIYDVSSAILKFPKLKHLVLKNLKFPKQELNKVILENFPKSLEYLSLGRGFHVTFAAAIVIEPHHSRIIFPDEQISNRRNFLPFWNRQNLPLFQNLKSLCCISCSLDSDIWITFDEVFPNISALMLRTDQKVNIDLLLQISSLKSVVIEPVTGGKFSNFRNLENVVPDTNGLKHSRGLRLFRQGENKPSSWKWNEASQNDLAQAHYACSGGSYFWTSLEDYQTKIRLKTFERDAFNSKNYVFKGQEFLQHSHSDTKTSFAGIHSEIQKDLKSIVLEDVEVTPRILSDSVQHCRSLRSMTLLNSEVIGNGRRYTFSTQNLTLVLDKEKVGNLTFGFIYEFVNGKLAAAVVPFQNFGRFVTTNSKNTLSRLFRNVSSIRLKPDDATTYLFDSTMLELQNSYRSVRDQFISHLPKSHPLKPMLKRLKEIKMAYKESILPLEWEFHGLQILDQNLVKKFYSNSVARFFGNLGVIRFLVKRYGKYLSVASLSLTAFQNQTNAFPPIQAISLSLIRDRYLASIIQN